MENSYFDEVDYYLNDPESNGEVDPLIVNLKIVDNQKILDDLQQIQGELDYYLNDPDSNGEEVNQEEVLEWEGNFYLKLMTFRWSEASDTELSHLKKIVSSFQQRDRHGRFS